VVGIFLAATYNIDRLAAAAIAKAEPLEHGERGVIINTASIAAYDGTIGQAAYAAAKGGIVSMTLPLARDLAPAGIRVVTIAPGTFLTPAFRDADPEQLDAYWGAAVPFPKRMGRADEYAKLATHIAENVYLNGETIRLDGALRFTPKGAR
jgi:NAD(P)-dependent dehydrogenase (short-subunit alcohol dehydrogenase family)